MLSATERPTPLPEDLIRLRTEELLRAKEAAEATRDMQATFFANINHELRSPLQSIMGYTEILLMHCNSDRPARREYLERILSSAQQLAALVDDVLDISRLDAGRLKLTPQVSDLYMLCGEVMHEFLHASQSRQIAMALARPALAVKVECDRRRIGQVVRNLLSNAVKFTPNGGMITVTFEEAILPEVVPSGVRSVPAVALNVRDTGPGIANEDREQIFDRYIQASRIRGDQPGTGLGLAISRELVLAHHGRIRADNHPEGGALFTVTLPIKVSSGVL